MKNPHKYRQKDNPQRQKCIPPDHGKELEKGTLRIKNLPELKDYLQQAIELEHFTIPPYLCALYSIRNQGSDEARIIRSVVMEEMLHMVQVANILIAIGGKPQIDPKKFVPKYPKLMPHSAVGFTVNLLKFSQESVKTFLEIERPAEKGVQPSPGKFRSIGEFYESVHEALRRLDLRARRAGDKRGIFTGKQPQVSPTDYNGGAGDLIIVKSMDDAKQAIDEIVGQGEGIDGTIEDSNMFRRQPGEDPVEIAHYFRFAEIFYGHRYKETDKPTDRPSGDLMPVDWNAVRNMVPNPKMGRFKNQPGLLKKAREFNRNYMRLLFAIHQACNGAPDAMWSQGVPLMHALREQAIELMNIPINNADYTAGPTFEYVPFS